GIDAVMGKEGCTRRVQFGVGDRLGAAAARPHRIEHARAVLGIAREAIGDGGGGGVDRPLPRGNGFSAVGKGGSDGGTAGGLDGNQRGNGKACFAQPMGCAHQNRAGADGGDDAGDRPLGLRRDLAAQRAAAPFGPGRGEGRIKTEKAYSFGEAVGQGIGLARPLSGADHQPAPCQHGQNPFARGSVGDDGDHGQAGAGAKRGCGDCGIAAGGNDDAGTIGLARQEFPDRRRHNPVLERPAQMAALIFDAHALQPRNAGRQERRPRVGGMVPISRRQGIGDFGNPIIIEITQARPLARNAFDAQTPSPSLRLVLPGIIIGAKWVPWIVFPHGRVGSGTGQSSYRKVIWRGLAMNRFHYGWVIVAAGAVITCVAMGAMFALPVYLAPIAEETGWTRAGISIAMTVGFVVMGVAGFLWGTLTDRIGAKPVVFIAAIILGVGLFLASSATDLIVFQLAYG